jgi:hypothetical protein
MVRLTHALTPGGGRSINVDPLVRVPDEFVVQLGKEVLSSQGVEEVTVIPTFEISQTSTLVDIVSGVRERLLFGPGYAVLFGDRMGKASDALLRAMHFLVCMGLGRPMWQTRARDMIVLVEDKCQQDPERARGFRSNTHMRMHTDGWDCAGLMCLSEPESGGANLFVSSQAVHDVIATEFPDFLRHLFELWDWDIRVYTDDSERRPIQAPIFSVFEGRLSCRYSSSMLRNGPSLLGRELTPNRSQALDIFEAVASRTCLTLRYLLRRGESVWMDNSRVLHGREAFRNSADGLACRRLLRLWAQIDGAPPKAPAFNAFDVLTFGQVES